MAWNVVPLLLVTTIRTLSQASFEYENSELKIGAAAAGTKPLQQHLVAAAGTNIFSHRGETLSANLHSAPYSPQFNYPSEEIPDPSKGVETAMDSSFSMDGVFINSGSGDREYTNPASGKRMNMNSPTTGDRRYLNPASGDRVYINPDSGERVYINPSSGNKLLYNPSSNTNNQPPERLLPISDDISIHQKTPSEGRVARYSPSDSRQQSKYNPVSTHPPLQINPLQVKVPHYVLSGQTVNLFCNFSLPHNKDFYSLKWFHNNEEIYRLIPGANRDLQRMVFKSDKFNIDITSSKMIGEREHILVLQHIQRKHAGEYKCQVTEDSPPFRFSESASRLVVMVLPERHPVISGVKSSPYFPGDRVSINCTSRRSFPAATINWLLNGRKVERWMLTAYSTEVDGDGLESSTLGLNFLALPDHFRGPDKQLTVSCHAVMPSIQGETMPLERTLLLGKLEDARWSYQEGWSTSSTLPSRVWPVDILHSLLAFIYYNLYWQF